MGKVLGDDGFKSHLTVYLAVNLLLFVINLLKTPDSYWFIWPLLGWGIGVLGHAYSVSKGVQKQQ